MIHNALQQALDEWAKLLDGLGELEKPLDELAQAMMLCWDQGGKILICGNGGSLSDAMHFAEELTVRFKKNRRALAAIALCDPAAITCTGNDFGYDQIFQRQVEALGNPGDMLIVLSTSGNSPNLLRAVEQARQQKLRTVSFLGKDGGKLHGLCDIELLIPAQATARIQEGQKLLFHTLCECVDSQVS